MKKIFTLLLAIVVIPFAFYLGGCSVTGDDSGNVFGRVTGDDSGKVFGGITECTNPWCPVCNSFDRMLSPFCEELMFSFTTTTGEGDLSDGEFYTGGIHDVDGDLREYRFDSLEKLYKAIDRQVAFPDLTAIAGEEFMFSTFSLIMDETKTTQIGYNITLTNAITESTNDILDTYGIHVIYDWEDYSTKCADDVYFIEFKSEPPFYLFGEEINGVEVTHQYYSPVHAGIFSNEYPRLYSYYVMDDVFFCFGFLPYR